MTVIPQNIVDAPLKNYDADDVKTIEDFTQKLIKTHTQRTKTQKGMEPTFHIMAGAPGAGKTMLGQEIAEEIRIPAFDFDTVLHEFYDDQGIKVSYDGMEEYEYWRAASHYMTNRLVNAMAEKRLSFIFSIASSDGGVLKLMEGMFNTGYKIVSHLCDAPQTTCNIAVSNRAIDGDRHVTAEDMRTKPAKARQNFLDMIGKSEAAHIYWRTDAGSGLSEIMRLSERETEVFDEKAMCAFNKLGRYVHNGEHHAQSFEREAARRHRIGCEIFKVPTAK